MNRGIYPNGAIMNLPSPILGNPVDSVFERPSIATLAPLVTPQVSYITIPQLTAAQPQFAPRTFAPVSTMAPGGGHPLSWIVSMTLAIILLMWIGKLLFKK